MRSRNSNQSRKPATFISSSNPCSEILIEGSYNFFGFNPKQELWVVVCEIEKEWKKRCSMNTYT